MHKERHEILEDTLTMLQELAGDWEYGGTIDEGTYLISDLGMESLDVVILSTEVQGQYSQTLPFTRFFEEIGERELKDATVGEWVDFIYTNLAAAEQPVSE